MIARGDEAGQTCQHDIVEFQIRIELSMPDAGSKNEQNNAQNLLPRWFFRKYQTKYEKQSKPSQYRVDAETQHIPDKMPFTRGTTCCP